MQNSTITPSFSSPLLTPLRLDMGFSLIRGHVLIVDDEQVIRFLLSESLAQEVFDCRDASGGSAALMLFDTYPCDAVISELRMPGPSGLELLEGEGDSK